MTDGSAPPGGPPPPAGLPPSTRGVLRLSCLGQGYGVGEPLTHRAVFVNGTDYRGAADNDLRGFLDGGFAWGWNQASQVHVRLGRLGGHAKPLHGEEELFRVVQRWDDVRLPGGADVLDARLVVEVEEPPARATTLLLYAVNRDWLPGEGGVHRNNVSAPAPGEVWWGAARHQSERWGLPGAGYASLLDPGADTDAMALAEVEVGEEAGVLTFASAALTRYAARRIAGGEPLLFLLKLPDDAEDTPGTFFSLYSANHGDLANPARRPRLEVRWSSRREAERREVPVHLEHGRTVELERLPARTGTWVASFQPEDASPTPTLEARWGTGEAASGWSTVPVPGPDAEWVQWRIRALSCPVALGGEFVTELSDTWVVTGPPETQRVDFWFTSPTGAEHAVVAEYKGDWRWVARWVPDEVGRWRYRWAQRFWVRPYVSPVGSFDVYAGDLDVVVEHLRRLAEAVEMSTMDRAVGQLRMLGYEREGLRLLDPDSFDGPEGEALRAALRRVRTAIWGRPVPDPLPLVSHDLLLELDGNALAEPIPHGRSYGVHLGGEDGGPAAARNRGRGLVSRLRRALQRALPGTGR